MADHGSHHQADQSEEELLEEESQEKEQDLTEQDSQQAGALIQSFASLVLIRTDRHNVLKNAFNIITDPKLSESLVNFAHPENISQVQRAINITRQELKKKGNKRKGFARSKFLFWKSNQVTPDDLYRARYATIVSKRIHRNINRNTQELKIQNYLNRFASNDADKTILRKSLNEWLKNNKHRNLDDALVSESRRQYRAKGEHFGKKEERELRKHLEQTRKTVINEMKGEIDRGTVVINSALNPNAPRPDASGLRPELKQIETGEIPAQKLASGFSEISSESADAIMGTDLPVSLKTTPQSITPPSPPVVPQPVTIKPPRINFSNRFTNFFQTRWNNITSSVGNFFRPLTSFFSNSRLGRLFGKGKSFVTRGLDLLMNGGKMLLNRGLDALLPGLGTAIGKINDVIKAITGIDFEGVVIAVIVIVPIVLVLIFVLYAGSSLSQIPSYGSQNAMSVTLKDNRNLGFSEFFEKYLVIGKDKQEWQQFESDNLRVKKIFLSDINSAP